MSPKKFKEYSQKARIKNIRRAFRGGTNLNAQESRARNEIAHLTSDLAFWREELQLIKKCKKE